MKNALKKTWDKWCEHHPKTINQVLKKKII
jgi:hypothetical protein